MPKRPNSQPLASIIIIDYKLNNPYLTECLNAIKQQTYSRYEIILLTDYPVKLTAQHLHKKSYGHYIGPAQKRDDGAKLAKGEILAFIDDDAYPHPDWLLHLVKAFQNISVAAVGGPGINPPGVTWQEAASGWASASPFGAGFYTYRFLQGKRQFVDDYPSMNLAVRRNAFLEIGGFDSHYWPGEDTKLCLDIVYKLHQKILYEPQALVFHHRRPLWLPHLRQHGNFGLHRGFFARVLPQTSLRPIYLGPSLMTLGVTYLITATLVPSLQIPHLYQSGLLLANIYLIAVVCNSLWIWWRSSSMWQALISIPSVIVTHWWYGLKFIQGFLLTNKLKR